MSEPDEIKDGDTVKLKSGGPLMTVVGPSTVKGMLLCTWFDADQKRHSDGFSRNNLVKDDGT